VSINIRANFCQFSLSLPFHINVLFPCFPLRSGGYSGGGYQGGGGGGGGGGMLGQGLSNIDFSKQELVPFEKNFYLEHPDVTKRSEQEAEAWRASKQIVVRGTDIPKPCMTFDEASMPEYVLQEVLKCGFDKPTPIQSQGWPMALKGRNMVGISATGSGYVCLFHGIFYLFCRQISHLSFHYVSGCRKTLAFLLPAMIHINAQVRRRS
jgi:ATP-dependent RNA helicase DDX5/DBP2